MSVMHAIIQFDPACLWICLPVGLWLRPSTSFTPASVARRCELTGISTHLSRWTAGSTSPARKVLLPNNSEVME
jgi:hypothetical protein